MQHTLPLGERSAHTAEKERQSGDTDYECMVYPHLSGISVNISYAIFIGGWYCHMGNTKPHVT